jgi:hypothetical protein
MTRKSSKSEEQFPELDQLRSDLEQEELLKNITKAQAELSKFLKLFSSARQTYLDGAATTINMARFRELVSGVEDFLLATIPEGQRESLRQQARDDVTDSGVTRCPYLVAPVALADLILHRLLVLVLKSHSNRFIGETRLPAWDRAIAEASSGLRTSFFAWEEFRLELGV